MTNCRTKKHEKTSQASKYSTFIDAFLVIGCCPTRVVDCSADTTLAHCAVMM